MRDFDRVLFCTLVVVLISSYSMSGVSASLENLYWGIQEGDKISYRYHSQYMDMLLVNETWEWGPVALDEEIYVLIDDLSDIPFPLSWSPSPVVTPFWKNGTHFPEESHESDFFTGNFRLFDPLALKLGNWSGIEEHTLQILEWSSNEYFIHTEWVNETDTTWNFTLINYWPDGRIQTISNRQYSKLDGVLGYVRLDYVSETNPNYLELTRIEDPSSIPIILSGAIGLVIAVLAIVLWKRRK